MFGRIAAIGAILLLAPVLSRPVDAQEWTVEAQAGRFHNLGARVNTASSSFGLGIRRDAPRNGLLLSAGLPLAANDPAWGFGSLWQRAVAERGALFAGIDMGGHGFLHHDRRSPEPSSPSPWPPGLRRLLGGLDDLDDLDRGATGLSAYGLGVEAIPVLGYTGTRARIEARSGVSYVHTAFDEGPRLNRTLHVSDLLVTVMPAPFFSLRAQAQRFGAKEATYDLASITAQLAHRYGSVWLSTGHWFSQEIEETPWAAGATLDFHDHARLMVAARRDAFDPLYLAGPRMSWSVGLGYRFGAPPPPAEPVPASYVEGRATILLPATEVEGQPRIAGDFNGWSPEPMASAGDNWSYTVAVTPGAYNYAFVTAQGEWFVPESLPGRKDDGMGGHVAVLVVR